ncbi:MAG: hypothetical protein J6O41_02940 [Clostridia bacterium]|nr:hypothetical protein [Clostridia bacterium]
MIKKWLKVHSKAYSKIYLLYGLLLGLTLVTFLIFTIYYCVSEYSFEYFIEDDPDIDLSGLKSFSFVAKYDIDYSPSVSNLGTTGKLYMDCYTGKCKYQTSYSCTQRICTQTDDDKQECEDIETTCYDYYSEKLHICSNQCRRSKGSSCGPNYCGSGRDSYHYYSSSCSHDSDSKIIDYSMSCNAENLVLYWGDLYYERINITQYKRYSYLNSAIPANESCPAGKKMCGILDNLGNKLCYPENENCPLNYITTNKSDSNYSITGSAKLTQSKEIYFSNQATENGTIVGGLFVDKI